MDVLVNGTVVSYAIYGTGPVLVLLHGSNSDGMGTFGRVIDQLGATRTLLVIDYGGCGRSTIPDGDLSLVVLTQQVAAVLRHARTSMVDVLGFSLGAVVAAALAAERPEAVSRLILVAGWATGKDDRHRLVFDTWARLQSIDPNLGQRFALSLLISPEGSEALGPGGLAALAQRPQQANTLRRIELGRDVEIREALSKIRSKSLVVGLSKDYLVPKGGSQALARLIPGSHYKEIDSGHAVLLENPGEFVRMVNEFLREPSGARR